MVAAYSPMLRRRFGRKLRYLDSEYAQVHLRFRPRSIFDESARRSTHLRGRVVICYRRRIRLPTLKAHGAARAPWQRPPPPPARGASRGTVLNLAPSSQLAGSRDARQAHTLKVCVLSSHILHSRRGRTAATRRLRVHDPSYHPPHSASQRDRLDHPRPCPTDARTETQKCRTGQTGRETGVLRVFGFCARLASYAQSLRQSSSFPINSSSFVAPALGPNSEELQGSVQGSVHVYGTGVFVKVAPWTLRPRRRALRGSSCIDACSTTLGCSGPLTDIYIRCPNPECARCSEIVPAA